MGFYDFFLTALTVFVIYQIIFSVLVRPYYAQKLMSEDVKNVTLPEVSLEVFFLLTVVLSLALGRPLHIQPYLLLGPIFLIYGFASLTKKFSFYIASALLFNFHRDLPYRLQIQKQRTVVTYCLFTSAVAFFLVSLFVSNPF